MVYQRCNPLGALSACSLTCGCCAAAPRACLHPCTLACIQYVLAFMQVVSPWQDHGPWQDQPQGPLSPGSSSNSGNSNSNGGGSGGGSGPEVNGGNGGGGTFQPPPQQQQQQQQPSPPAYTPQTPPGKGQSSLGSSIPGSPEGQGGSSSGGQWQPLSSVPGAGLGQWAQGQAVGDPGALAGGLGAWPPQIFGGTGQPGQQPQNLGWEGGAGPQVPVFSLDGAAAAGFGSARLDGVAPAPAGQGTYPTWPSSTAPLVIFPSAFTPPPTPALTPLGASLQPPAPPMPATLSGGLAGLAGNNVVSGLTAAVGGAAGGPPAGNNVVPSPVVSGAVSSMGGGAVSGMGGGAVSGMVGTAPSMGLKGNLSMPATAAVSVAVVAGPASATAGPAGGPATVMVAPLGATHVRNGGCLSAM